MKWNELHEHMPCSVSTAKAFETSPLASTLRVKERNTGIGCPIGAGYCTMWEICCGPSHVCTRVRCTLIGVTEICVVAKVIGCILSTPVVATP